MRLNTAIELVRNAPTGRLQRLLHRLALSPGAELRPRDGVRYLWWRIIADVLAERRHALVMDN